MSLCIVLLHSYYVDTKVVIISKSIGDVALVVREPMLLSKAKAENGETPMRECFHKA